jgi:hypothetical protein
MRYNYTKQLNSYQQKSYLLMNITEIKTAVKELSQNERAELLEWLDEFQEALWDRQIEEDLKAGKFDQLMRQAEQAFSEGKCREI